MNNSVVVDMFHCTGNLEVKMNQLFFGDPIEVLAQEGEQISVRRILEN